MLRRMSVPRLSVLLLLCLAGCQPSIGDSCNNSGDCSANGARVCDLAQPGGYCTILGCDPDTCPGSSICVEWRFDPSRTAESWCMESCRTDGGCRNAYLCARAEEIAKDGSFAQGTFDEQGNLVSGGVAEADRVARVIDLDEGATERAFCVARQSM